MDKKSAKKLLLEHKDALETLLKSEGLADVKAEVESNLEQAKDASKKVGKNLAKEAGKEVAKDQAKQTVVQRAVEQVQNVAAPIIEKVTTLGTAGTVAMGTAAVTQVELATDQTETLVALVANDVVEQRIEAPMFIDVFVDFDAVNDWGQEVMAEKVEEAQTFADEVSEQIQIATPEHSSEDSKLGNVVASPSSGEKASQESKSEQPVSEQQTEPQKEGGDEKQESQSESDKESQETEDKSEKVEEKSSKDSDPKEDKEDKPVKDPEPKTEDKKQSEQKTPSEEIKEEVKEEVKNNPPKVETPNIEEMNPIRPHDLVEPSPMR
jgi:hypothetical protein